MPRPKKPARPGPKLRGSTTSRPLAIRVTDEERARYETAAEAQSITLGQFAREALELAVARGSTR